VTAALSKYFVVHLKWSQTDHETVIIMAASKEEAQQKLASCNARYKDGFVEARMIG